MVNACFTVFFRLFLKWKNQIELLSKPNRLEEKQVEEVEEDNFE